MFLKLIIVCFNIIWYQCVHLLWHVFFVSGLYTHPIYPIFTFTNIYQNTIFVCFALSHNQCPFPLPRVATFIINNCHIWYLNIIHAIRVTFINMVPLPLQSCFLLTVYSHWEPLHNVCNALFNMMWLYNYLYNSIMCSHINHYK